MSRSDGIQWGQDPMAKKSLFIFGTCCAHPECNSRELLAANFGNPALKRVQILLQFSEIGSWRIDYHAIHPISPHCSLMLLCNYSHMSC